MRLQGFKIGNLAVDHPVFLAPMSGVTDLPFRQKVQDFGVGLVFSEMIVGKFLLAETKRTLQMARFDHPGIAALQLAGCEPDVLAEAARVAQDRGVQLIDLNFGCPVKKVAQGQQAGSALMRDEILAGQILSAVVNAVDIPVSLKMRTGWDDENRNAPRLARIAEQSGIQMITVHGRTRNQLYNGVADWRFVKQVKEAVTLPVVVNGDIVSFDSVSAALAQSGADGVMIGRGCYGKPWFPSQVMAYVAGAEKNDPSLSEKQDIILSHYHSMIEHYGVDVGVRMARKHLGWYAGDLDSDLRKELMMLDHPDQVTIKISNWFTRKLN